MSDYSKITKSDIENAMSGYLEFPDDPDRADEIAQDVEDAVRYGYSDGKFIEGIGTFKVVEEWMSREYEDSYSHIVVQHVESGKNFLSTGYYSSWDGTDWNEGSFEEVEPYEKTVTRYRKVK